MVVHHDIQMVGVLSILPKGYMYQVPSNIYFAYHSGNLSRPLLFIIFQIKSLGNSNIFNCQRKASYEGWLHDCFKTRELFLKKLRCKYCKNSNSNAGPRRKGHRKTLKQGTVWTIERVSQIFWPDVLHSLHIMHTELMVNRA